MQIHDDKYYSAIFQRHSRRQFDGRKLSKDFVTKLSDFAILLNDQVPGARAVVVNENPDKVFKGAVGNYGKVKGAPAYAAFIGNMKDPNVQEKVGYLGEYFVLEATSMGLATCWIGGFFRLEVVQAQIHLDANEQILAVTPIGFAKEEYTLEEKMMSGFAKSHKRRNLETLCLTLPKEQSPAWIISALEAAQVAPSAVNRQPWRFSVEDETIKVSMDNLRDSYHISKRLDCGIAMAHIELGAKHERVIGQWEYLGNIDVARFKIK
ncbi:nitroreductase family protein [Desulfitobacterium sp.]|uniref:nitroreductase family protein n=1 Tax=Desulfitobacterium sp. TaxID=49981 RepID=UPI002B21640B|nr:nitroreductase family protein [Desulfitobacterium sp.]MEA4900536.1 nitroreductase family protein [Desulfitobacterium sp.]